MIYGERIRFRALERADLPSCVQWLNDPEVLRGIMIHQPISQAGEDSWFETMIKKPPDEQVLGIEVCLPGEQPAGGGETAWKLIGSWGFNEIDWRSQSAEFGIMIGDKSYWNRGYGTEAVRLVVQHGFRTLNLHRIFLHVFENNPRAIRAYEKAGFIHEGRKRQAEFKDGEYLDVLVMSMLSDEFSSTTPGTIKPGDHRAGDPGVRP